MTAAKEFSLSASLPVGIEAIEASAGTGKTFALASLVVRYVAEADIKIDEFLIVTFTRAAAAELRDRVRSRLADTAAMLRTANGQPIRDELCARLALSDRTLHIDRIERALNDFDSATITTIHGFAQTALKTFGSTGTYNSDAQLVGDTSEFTNSVCSDALASAAISAPGKVDLRPDLKTLRGLVDTVLSNPDITIVPPVEVENEEAAEIRRLLDSALAIADERRRAAGMLTYDDWLTELHAAIRTGGPGVATLQQRYRVALIDEFQDTDRVQWEIFSMLFANRNDGSALVLVGDPKQAIYAFRGANIFAYLQARDDDLSGYETLGTNWRSDAALLSALEQLFTGSDFGNEQILFSPVKPADDNVGRRLLRDDGSVLPALRIRAALGDDLLAGVESGPLAIDKSRDAIAADLAERVHDLLQHAILPATAEEPPRRVRPGDIAVVVRTHKEEPRIQAELRALGIPAVITKGDNVMKSAAAEQWRWLLHALVKPNDHKRIRSVALSWFFGYSLSEVAHLDDAELERIQDRVEAWAASLSKHGVAEFCAHVRTDSNVTERILGLVDGDRNVTDLDHIASLLHGASGGRKLSAVGLLAAHDRIEAADKLDNENNNTARHVESESAAVQIMTVFAAKGLEFPIVCIPEMWSDALSNQKRKVIYQDPAANARTFDVANNKSWPNSEAAKDRKNRADAEMVGEHGRLLYVALTRAKHQALLWWATARKGENSGLAKLLYGRTEGQIDPDKFEKPANHLPASAEAFDQVALIFPDNNDEIEIAVIGLPTYGLSTWVDPEGMLPTGDLEVAQLSHVPDRSRQRWSFTSIAQRTTSPSQSHGVRIQAADPDDDTLGDAGANDEPLDPIERENEPSSLMPGVIPLGDIRGGTEFGNLVHHVLEHVDFSAKDIDSDLQDAVTNGMRIHPWPVGVAELAAGLRDSLETPLGPMFNMRRLRDFAQDDRLDELKFELRLGESGHVATVTDIGKLLLHHLPDQDTMRPWANDLASGSIDVDLAGHLTGSIDLILRVRNLDDPDAAPRFIVSDYKTNRLRKLADNADVGDYHPHQLIDTMADHDYALQALLYSVALHRYLRWRLADYDPAIHFGGIAYLFLRGMIGAETPTVEAAPYGVFTWQLPPALVVDLSALLDGAGRPR